MSWWYQLKHGCTIVIVATFRMSFNMSPLMTGLSENKCFCSSFPSHGDECCLGSGVQTLAFEVQVFDCINGCGGVGMALSFSITTKKVRFAFRIEVRKRMCLWRFLYAVVLTIFLGAALPCSCCCPRNYPIVTLTLLARSMELSGKYPTPMRSCVIGEAAETSRT